MQGIKTTVPLANIYKFIENQKNYTQFCGRLLSQSIYIND